MQLQQRTDCFKKKCRFHVCFVRNAFVYFSKFQKLWNLYESVLWRWLKTASEKQTVDLPLHNGCGMAPVRWSCHSAMLKLHVSTFSGHTNEKVCNPIIHKRVSLLHSRNWNGCFRLGRLSGTLRDLFTWFSQAPNLRNVSRIKLSADRIDLTNRELLQLDREESNQRSKPLFRSEFGKTESTQGNFHPFKVTEPQRTAVFVGRSVEKGTMLGVLLWAGVLHGKDRTHTIQGTNGVFTYMDSWFVWFQCG